MQWGMANGKDRDFLTVTVTATAPVPACVEEDLGRLTIEGIGQ